MKNLKIDDFIVGTSEFIIQNGELFVVEKLIYKIVGLKFRDVKVSYDDNDGAHHSSYFEIVTKSGLKGYIKLRPNAQ